MDKSKSTILPIVGMILLGIAVVIMGVYFLYLLPQQKRTELEFERQRYEDEQTEEREAEEEENARQEAADITSWSDSHVWCTYASTPSWMEIEDCYHECCLSKRVEFIRLNPSLPGTDIERGLQIMDEQCFHEFPYEE